MGERLPAYHLLTHLPLGKSLVHAPGGELHLVHQAEEESHDKADHGHRVTHRPSHDETHSECKEHHAAGTVQENPYPASTEAENDKLPVKALVKRHPHRLNSIEDGRTDYQCGQPDEELPERLLIPGDNPYRDGG